ncbi:MAG TPA: hypothetical protein VG474_01285 [Solirubrobacteraceae bacterium]|nr:hypothetical protein [Solirubrobacteraceae bacterium]
MVARQAPMLASGSDVLISRHAALGLYAVRPHPLGGSDVTVIGRRVR